MLQRKVKKVPRQIRTNFGKTKFWRTKESDRGTSSYGHMSITLLALGRTSKFTNDQEDFSNQGIVQVGRSLWKYPPNLEAGHEAPCLQHSTRQINDCVHCCSLPGTELRAAPSALGTAASHWEGGILKQPLQHPSLQPALDWHCKARLTEIWAVLELHKCISSLV